MSSKEFLLVHAIAERLRPTRSRSRKGAGQIPAREASWQAGAADVLGNESSIEAVSCSDGIHRRDRNGWADKLLSSLPGDGAFYPSLGHDHRNHLA